MVVRSGTEVTESQFFLVASQSGPSVIRGSRSVRVGWNPAPDNIAGVPSRNGWVPGYSSADSRSVHRAKKMGGGPFARPPFSSIRFPFTNDALEGNPDPILGSAGLVNPPDSYISTNPAAFRISR